MSIGIVFLCFLCAIIVWSLIVTTDIDAQTANFLALISMGLLLVLFLLFILYELFTKEESKNIALQSELQKLELQSHFYQEIDAMYTDMRKWRHDYKINLTALRALVESSEKDKTLAYIDKIANEPLQNQKTLQTGNTVLDAVVSSKLWLAQSFGIDVTIQAVYPENNIIEDNDICSIAGNLLDNAIEACERMTESDGKRFIDVSLLVKSKNLTLTVSNSFNGTLKLNNERYQSTKDGFYHGTGILLIDSVVDKYQGYVMRSHQMGVFTTKVMLPLIKQGSE